MDHLLAIRVFARVVETGSFTRAADSLQMPNATVTKLIQGLEAQLGVKLLERTTRRVSVTVEGAAYYERTGHVLADLDDIEATLASGQSSPRGRLRIDTGGSVASGIIIPALPEFCARYPDIEIQLGVTDRTVDMVAENIDCAIRSTATDPSLVTRQIGLLSWVTCASPAYLERHGVPDHPHKIETDGHVVAGYFSAQSGRIQPLRFSRQGQSFDIEARNSIIVNESNAHLATALAGLGLVHTLDFMVRPYLDRGELIAVLDDWRPPAQPAYVAYPPARRINPKLRVFVEWVAALFSRTA